MSARMPPLAPDDTMTAASPRWRAKISSTSLEFMAAPFRLLLVLAEKVEGCPVERVRLFPVHRVACFRDHQELSIGQMLFLHPHHVGGGAKVVVPRHEKCGRVDSF